jgi:hypothetical protein
MPPTSSICERSCAALLPLAAGTAMTLCAATVQYRLCQRHLCRCPLPRTNANHASSTLSSVWGAVTACISRDSEKKNPASSLPGVPRLPHRFRAQPLRTAAAHRRLRPSFLTALLCVGGGVSHRHGSSRAPRTFFHGLHGAPVRNTTSRTRSLWRRTSRRACAVHAVVPDRRTNREPEARSRQGLSLRGEACTAVLVRLHDGRPAAGVRLDGQG